MLNHVVRDSHLCYLVKCDGWANILFGYQRIRCCWAPDCSLVAPPSILHGCHLDSPVELRLAAPATWTLSQLDRSRRASLALHGRRLAALLQLGHHVSIVVPRRWRRRRRQGVRWNNSCMFSDFGCHAVVLAAGEPHAANWFLSEWFASRPLSGADCGGGPRRRRIAMPIPPGSPVKSCAPLQESELGVVRTGKEGEQSRDS
jgi:hypothetical protein